MLHSEEVDGDRLKQSEAYIKAMQHGRRGKRRTTARDKIPPDDTKERGSAGAVSYLVRSKSSGLPSRLQPVGIIRPSTL